ncbi:MalY/PatB family protein [Niveibacterium terrae]|uniref:MalY/PatB family protein n=1 Tax=Niveibacterium terrae TaxID=3373598 RepID=UPI003A908A15
MAFDFETPLALENARTLKWARYAGRDVIPMWVADMDFRSPPCVIEALQGAVARGHFAYQAEDDAVLSAITTHLEEQYGWRVDPSWIVCLPGLVVGINLAVRASGEPGDPVFCSTPVYPPFLAAPKNSGRPLRTTELKRGETRWEYDFDAVEAVLPGCKTWLLCHPHNPVGRAWDESELARIAALAERHDSVICSDEIHCGLLLAPGARHRPLAFAHPEIAHRTITLMAPSKTFNIPGLGAAFAVIPDAELRRRFQRAAAGIVPHVGQLGLIGMEAALRGAEPWRQALLEVLRRNAAEVEATVAAQPGLAMTPVEATYLAWIDCREWAKDKGIANAQKALEAAGLGLSDGSEFGAPGFVRLNFGCPPTVLREGLKRLATAVIK